MRASLDQIDHDCGPVCETESTWRVPRERVQLVLESCGPDVGLEGTMNRWLVGSDIPRRTLCASCAARTSWLLGA